MKKLMKLACAIAIAAGLTGCGKKDFSIRIDENLNAVITAENASKDMFGGAGSLTVEEGQKVVVVEDLISTGGSAIETVTALRDAGAEVLGIVSIFTYGMKKGLDRMKEAEVLNYSLTDFDCVVETAAETGYIKAEDKERLIAFRNDPSDESWIRK